MDGLTSEIVQAVASDEAFQAACQRYAHGNGTSASIAAAALRAYLVATSKQTGATQ